MNHYRRAKAIRWVLFFGVAVSLEAFGQVVIPKYGLDKTNISAPLKKRFTLMLPANRETGYQWQLAEPVNGEIVRLSWKDYLTPFPPKPGKGGNEAWTFQAAGPGQTVIRMVYLKPWMKNEKPAKTVEFTVTVQ